MSDRIRHLRRQQTLLREHLAWIEAEIARESPLPPHLDSPTTDAPPAITAPAIPVESIPAPRPTSPTEATTADADSLLERYGSSERQNPADIRRGCFVVFFAALFTVAAAVGLVWILFYR